MTNKTNHPKRTVDDEVAAFLAKRDAHMARVFGDQKADSPLVFALHPQAIALWRSCGGGSNSGRAAMRSNPARASDAWRMHDGTREAMRRAWAEWSAGVQLRAAMERVRYADQA